MRADPANPSTKSNQPPCRIVLSRSIDVWQVVSVFDLRLGCPPLGEVIPALLDSHSKGTVLDLPLFASLRIRRAELPHKKTNSKQWSR